MDIGRQITKVFILVLRAEVSGAYDVLHFIGNQHALELLGNGVGAMGDVQVAKDKDEFSEIGHIFREGAPFDVSLVIMFAQAGNTGQVGKVICYRQQAATERQRRGRPAIRGDLQIGRAHV